MPLPPAPDWPKLIEATFPLHSEAERESLLKIWATNYQNFAPLKAKVNAEIDPDCTFDVTASGSLGEAK